MRDSEKALLAGAVFAALTLAGCGGATASKTATSPPAAEQSSSQAPAPSAPASTPDSLTGPLGTSFTVTSTDNSTNATTKYIVIATKVLDPASGGDAYTTPDPGKRFVGVEFTITGVSGYSQDDANSDASVMGGDGQAYQPDFSTISAGTNFNSGDFSVSAGQTETGWVTFQLPNGVSAASVQWQADEFGGNPPATWNL